MKKMLLTLGIFLGFDSQAMDFRLPNEGNFVARELVQQVVIGTTSGEEEGASEVRTVTTYGAAMRVMSNSGTQTATTTFQQTFIQNSSGGTGVPEINEFNQFIPTIVPSLMDSNSPTSVAFTPLPLSTVFSGGHNHIGNSDCQVLNELTGQPLNKTQVIELKDAEQKNSEMPHIIAGAGGANTNSEAPVVSRTVSTEARRNAPAIEDFVNVPLEVLEKNKMKWYYIYNGIRIGQVCINGLGMLLSGITSYVLLNGTAEGEEGPTINRTLSGGICATSAIVNIVSGGITWSLKKIVGRINELNRAIIARRP